MNADGQVNNDQGVFGVNLFAYCLNNPIMGVDPDGHEVNYISSFYNELKKLLMFYRASISYTSGSGGRYCTISLMNGKYKHTFAMGGNSDIKMERYAFYQAMGFKCSRVVKNVTVSKWRYFFKWAAVVVISAVVFKGATQSASIGVGIGTGFISNSFLSTGAYQVIDTTLFIGGAGYYYTEEVYKKGVDQRGNTNYQLYKIFSKQNYPMMIA